MPYHIPPYVNQYGEPLGGGSCTLEYVTGFICPEDTTQINGQCILVSDPSVITKAREAVGYEFEYYENGGELIGKYIYKDASREGCSVSYYFDGTWEYPGQNGQYGCAVYCHKVQHLGLVDPLKTNINQNTDSILYIPIRFFSDEENETLENPVLYTFYHGQTFLLPNHPNAIKSINISYDTIIDTVGDWNFDAGAGFSYQGEGPVFNAIAGEIIPSGDFEAYGAFMQTYIGIARLQDFDIPYNFKAQNIAPEINKEVYGTSTLKAWQQIPPSCFSWYPINNKDDLNRLSLGSLGSQLSSREAGQYVIDFKTVLNLTRIKESLKEMGNIPVTSVYSFGIVHYPISVYLYPIDMVSEVTYPRSSYVNNNMDYIEFIAPKNYKTNGNIHFKIDFVELIDDYIDPYAIIASSSSYNFETYNGDTVTYDPYTWFYSIDGKNWLSMTRNRPSFDNIHSIYNGGESEDTVLIKYYLPDSIKRILRYKTNISFRISSLDGTLAQELF